MALFNQSTESMAGFKQYTQDLAQIMAQIDRYASVEDLRQLAQLKKNFELKVDDFYDQNRKLNIGVVGQVKAGKSSFLNTVLFQGQEILPKASTPKTATLTKMEYAQENVIHIEYYTEDEWAVIEENAAVDLEEEIYISARELQKMAVFSGINVAEFLHRGTEDIQFASYDELLERLNDYVGENGRYTPLIKAVTLFMNKEAFRGISIVDTPGLNDPIASRTIRTKEFIEVCDVVFFLSQAGNFLDVSDWRLLSSQLPQKGVKKLVLIASKYDSGIRDVLQVKGVVDDPFADDEADENSTDSIEQACEMIQGKLTRRAGGKVTEFVEDLQRRGSSEELIRVIEQCREPLLISAMAHNMAQKSPDAYNAEEENVYQGLLPFSKDIHSDLCKIGNIGEVEKILSRMVAEKEQILAQKERSFIPTAVEEVRGLLSEIQAKAEKKLAILSGNDRGALIEQKNAIEMRANGIKAAIKIIFGELATRLETEKATAVRELRAAAKEHGGLSERVGTKENVHSYSVSTSTWYNPFSWGSSRTEYYTTTESYTYLQASDAVENLRIFSLEATNTAEKVFAEVIQFKELKRKLLNAVVEHVDLSSDRYDSSLIKILVEESINKIVFPVLKIDVSQAMSSISAKFSGELTSSDEKSNLQTALLKAVAHLLEAISGELANSVQRFKGEMALVQNDFGEQLLVSIYQELAIVLEQFDHREAEIKRYQDYLACLQEQLRRL